MTRRQLLALAATAPALAVLPMPAEPMFTVCSAVDQASGSVTYMTGTRSELQGMLGWMPNDANRLIFGLNRDAKT